jgi:cell division protein FtsB
MPPRRPTAPPSAGRPDAVRAPRPPASSRPTGSTRPAPASKPAGTRPGTAARAASTTRRRDASQRRPALARPVTLILGTFVVLVLLLAPSVKPWLEQRAALGDLREDVETAQAEVNALEAQRDRWLDPDYLRAQSRQRLNFVLPGQTRYVIIDDRPKPSSDPGRTAQTLSSVDRAWYADLWHSVEEAGNESTVGTVGGPADLP